MEPVTELLSLQVLLRQVLQVTLAVSMPSSTDNNLVTSGITGNAHSRAELPSLSVDLETVMEEVLEGGHVEDGVGGGAGAVDGELAAGLADNSDLLLLEQD